MISKAQICVRTSKITDALENETVDWMPVMLRNKKHTTLRHRASEESFAFKHTCIFTLQFFLLVHTSTWKHDQAEDNTSIFCREKIRRCCCMAATGARFWWNGIWVRRLTDMRIRTNHCTLETMKELQVEHLYSENPKYKML